MELGKLEYLISIKTGDIDSELKKSENKVKKFGDKLSAWTVAKGQVLGRLTERAVSTTVSAFTNTIKGAFNAFKDYEQLVGGIDTLFKSSSQKVQNYASQAYKTVGISANEYMETVTSFSASLLQSLGNDTDKAADIADMAMTDMADNMNKMGSSMESIQNAYKGFAKQNYTMLDNLKLGYGGTKSEMQRLLKDAQKLTGQKYDIKNLKDVYEAIHAIQKEMGITGTTQEEAMTTVAGSMNAAKAAWKDVLTAIGSGKDVKKAIKNFAQTAKVTLKNMKPVIMETLRGVGTAAKEIFPVIIDIAREVITELYNKASSWFKKNIWQPIVDHFNSAWDTIKKLWEKAGDLISEAWGNIATWFDENVWQPIASFFTSAWDTIKQLWTGITESVSSAWSTVSSWLNDNVWQPIAEFFAPIWDIISNLWTDIIGGISSAWNTVAKWFDENVWQPIKNFFQPVWDVISQLWTNISSTISEAWSKVCEVLEPIIKPIRDLFQGVVDVVSKIWNTLKDIFGLGDKTITVTTVYKEQGKKAAEVGGQLIEAGAGDNPEVQDRARDNLKTGFRNLFGHAKGNWYVPYDNYPSLLHRGEMVLSKSQARQLRDGESGGGVDITRAINEAFSKVYVMMSGEKVGDLTTKRVKNNINANSYSRIRAYGG